MRRIFQIALSPILLGYVFGTSIAQDIPGVSDCLLFDTRLEKEAFESSKKNNCDPLIFLLASEADTAYYDNIKGTLQEYAASLMSKKPKFSSETEFLSYSFRDVHRKFLKKYVYPETFVGIFDDGSFNCISGTALLACLLDRLGYKPKLFETRYHVFIRLDLDGTMMLFESTDPQNGVVIGKKHVANRIDEYLEQEFTRLNTGQTLSAPFHRDKMLKEINLRELSGLHYYNTAVNFVNEEDYHNALRALKKAALLYPDSQRIRHLTELARMAYDSRLSEFASRSISN